VRISVLFNFQEILPLTVVQQVQELFIPQNEVEMKLKEASEMPVIQLTKLDLQWVQVLSEGWATPLSGFMREKEYLQCLHFGVLVQGMTSMVV
jgi:3'-phosphoadenosine 5'-phosphosulfate synthase